MTVLEALAGLATIAVGGELVGAGTIKLLRAPATAAALRPGPTTSLLTGADGLGLRVLGVAELTAGAATWALWLPGRIAAAALLAVFAAWQVQGVARGRSGTPCPCLGPSGTVGRASVAHVVGLALVAAALALTHAPDLSVAGWLALIVAVLAVAGAAATWVAYGLAREVAVLRARTGPRGALEIEVEGPARGSECPLIERFSVSGGELAVAVFVSPGCGVCGRLAPAVAELGEQPGVQLVVFDEERDALAWRAAAIPGSPYAVAMSAHGIVLAKGTFNTPEQLHSIPGTALWRRAADVAGV